MVEDDQMLERAFEFDSRCPPEFIEYLLTDIHGNKVVIVFPEYIVYAKLYLTKVDLI